MEDIRQLELETQKALKEKMAHAEDGYCDSEGTNNQEEQAGIAYNSCFSTHLNMYLLLYLVLCIFVICCYMRS